MAKENLPEFVSLDREITKLKLRLEELENYSPHVTRMGLFERMEADIFRKQKEAAYNISFEL